MKYICQLCKRAFSGNALQCSATGGNLFAPNPRQKKENFLQGTCPVHQLPLSSLFSSSTQVFEPWNESSDFCDDTPVSHECGSLVHTPYTSNDQNNSLSCPSNIQLKKDEENATHTYHTPSANALNQWQIYLNDYEDVFAIDPITENMWLSDTHMVFFCQIANILQVNIVCFESYAKTCLFSSIFDKNRKKNILKKAI